MEREVIEILSEYLSPQAAANLLARAKARLTPTTPQDWARLLEGPLWEELRAILPFREMPPGLKALVRRLKAATPPPPKPQGEAVPEAAPALEAVDLADPEERDRLARSLARLEGVTGVVVAWRRLRVKARSGAKAAHPRTARAAAASAPTGRASPQAGNV